MQVAAAAAAAPSKALAAPPAAPPAVPAVPAAGSKSIGGREGARYCCCCCCGRCTPIYDACNAPAPTQSDCRSRPAHDWFTAGANLALNGLTGGRPQDIKGIAGGGQDKKDRPTTETSSSVGVQHGSGRRRRRRPRRRKRRGHGQRCHHHHSGMVEGPMRGRCACRYTPIRWRGKRWSARNAASMSLRGLRYSCSGSSSFTLSSCATSSDPQSTCATSIRWTSNGMFLSVISEHFTEPIQRY